MSRRFLLVLVALLAGCIVVDRSAVGDDDDSVPGGGGPAGPGGDSDPGGGAGGPSAPLPSSSGCDGSIGAEIPQGFPTLGVGCRARFQYHWENTLFGSSGDEDEAGPRGIRRFPDDISLSQYDVGLDWGDGFQIVYLFLPSLEPGTYRDEDGAFAGHALTSWYESRNPSTDGVFIEVAGRAGDVVWGRFVAHVCNFGDDSDCYRFEGGRFSAAIDSEPSDYEFGFPPQGERVGGAWMCESSADCSVADCVVSSCSDARCIAVPVEGACPPGQTCDWNTGCTPW